MKGARTAVIRLSPSLALRIRLLLSVSTASPSTTPPLPNGSHRCHESQSANESPFITHEAPHAEMVGEGKGPFGQFGPGYLRESLCDLK